LVGLYAEPPAFSFAKNCLIGPLWIPHIFCEAATSGIYKNFARPFSDCSADEILARHPLDAQVGPPGPLPLALTRRLDALMVPGQTGG
jgi:hypothetical protein